MSPIALQMMGQMLCNPQSSLAQRPQSALLCSSCKIRIGSVPGRNSWQQDREDDLFVELVRVSRWLVGGGTKISSSFCVCLLGAAAAAHLLSICFTNLQIGLALFSSSFSHDNHVCNVTYAIKWCAAIAYVQK